MGVAERRACLAVAMLAMAIPRTAIADGAFPDAEIVLAPLDHPTELVLVTNFGLMFSEDDGKTWMWACEQDVNAFGLFYQYGASPRHRLFTVANRQVMFADDQSCGWIAAGGMVAGQDVSDVWADRVTVDRVLAVGVSGQMIHSVFASTNGGTTFDTRLYQTAPGASITGVESAHSDPKTIYVTFSGAAPDGGRPPPTLARTIDGGVTWTIHDLTDALGPGSVRLVAVDPQDPKKVFLLWSGVDGQALGVTEDGGETVRNAFVPDGVIRAFLRMDDGTVLVASETATAAGLHRSRDGAKTFTALDNPPHVRGLAERNGTIFAATANFSDGYALGASTDAGTTWKALMSYADVRAIVPCLKATCQASCDNQVQLDLWSAAVCAADAPTQVAGTGGSASVPDAGAGGAPTGGGGAGGKNNTGGKSGTGARGGCSVASSAAGPTSLLATLLLLACLSPVRRTGCAGSGCRTRPDA